MILSAKGITKSFRIDNHKSIDVLRGIDLDIKEGEFIAMMGHSGAGKSTLLHILSSLDTADKGNIVIDINNMIYDFSKMNPEGFTSMRNKQIGFVFQFHHLLPEFTAIENIMIPSLISGLSHSKSREKAENLISIVGLEEQKEQKPAVLSGGEQQRVAIARALINEPAIVFADEPTGNLDKSNSQSILRLLQQLQEEMKMTFIIATHSDEVSSIAQKVLIMSDGKINVN